MQVKIRMAAILPLFLASCAAQPDKFVATYVSPSTYSNHSCKRIISERNLVVQKVNELTGIQKKNSDSDAAIMGTGKIIFWPVLTGLAARSDVEPQLATMKGN